MSALMNNAKGIYKTIKKWAWLFILLVAVGGLWEPKLGLLMLPIMMTLMVMGLLKGKFWCGNFCPHGSLFDHVLMPVSFKRKIPTFFQSKIVQGIAFAWFTYMLGIRMAKVFGIFGTVSFTDKLGYIFVMNYLVVTVVGTFLAVFISPRTWCSVCPMGTMQLLMYKLGTAVGLNQKTDQKIVMHTDKKCYECGKCAKACPMQLSPYTGLSEKNTFENEYCIRCSACVDSCPAKVLALRKETDVAYRHPTLKFNG